MCEAHAYLLAETGEERIMENVVRVRPEGEEVVLTDLFGDQVRVQGRILEIALVDRRIVIEKA
jgi:predicted RNA-binding protein